jgi:hypothetical protein
VRFVEAASALGLYTSLTPSLPLGATKPSNRVADPEGQHLVVLAKDPTGYARLTPANTTAQLAREGAPRARPPRWWLAVTRVRLSPRRRSRGCRRCRRGLWRQQGDGVRHVRRRAVVARRLRRLRLCGQGPCFAAGLVMWRLHRRVLDDRETREVGWEAVSPAARVSVQLHGCGACGPFHLVLLRSALTCCVTVRRTVRKACVFRGCGAFR